MKVLKFGGTSLGSAQRICHVADLVGGCRGDILVLSAMSGTTNSLVEIAEYLYKGNAPGAQEIINALEAKYVATLSGLFGATAPDNEATRTVAEVMAFLRAKCEAPLDAEGEKEILARGELMSTAMMHALLTMRGMKAVIMPALDCVCTLDGG